MENSGPCSIRSLAKRSPRLRAAAWTGVTVWLSVVRSTLVAGIGRAPACIRRFIRRFFHSVLRGLGGFLRFAGEVTCIAFELLDQLTAFSEHIGKAILQIVPFACEFLAGLGSGCRSE